jgi:hypothetical protein
MQGWHGLAAFLTVMAMRRAPHRFAALDGVLRRSHAEAIESMACKSDSKHHHKHAYGKPHKNQGRGTTVRESRLSVSGEAPKKEPRPTRGRQRCSSPLSSSKKPDDLGNLGEIC